MPKRDKKPWYKRIEDHPDLPFIAWVGSFVLWAFMMALAFGIIWFFKAP